MIENFRIWIYISLMIEVFGGLFLLSHMLPLRNIKHPILAVKQAFPFLLKNDQSQETRQTEAYVWSKSKLCCALTIFIRLDTQPSYFC